MSNNFKNTLESWLLEGLSSNIPKSVKAFSFNLFEIAEDTGSKFSIELIGTSEFTPNNEDWACEEVWEPNRRSLAIPIEFSGENWKKCLNTMKENIIELIDSNETIAKVIKSREGVGLGFIDGDFEIIWKR